MQHAIEVQPLVECKSWCQFGDSHANTRYRVDQWWCISEELQVDLSLHEPLEDSILDEATDAWISGPDYLEVFLMQRPDEELFAGISRSGNAETRLTAAEAQQLIEALQLTLGQIGQVRR